MAEFTTTEAIQLGEPSDRISVYNAIVQLGINIEEVNARIDEHDTAIIEGENAESEDVSGSLVGIKRQTIDDMYELYCQHAKGKGFSVRKGKNRLSSKGVQLTKLFYCSCEGMRRTTDAPKEKLIGVTRTGCKALLKVKLNVKEGFYEVVEHEMIHNHGLTRTEWSYQHRSEREITGEKAQAIKELIESGMKATESYYFMMHEAGGEEKLGHSWKDHVNFVARLRMDKIEAGDAQTFVNTIQTENSEDPEFFYRVKLDEKSRLSNIFWRDSRMKDDYMVYGDVVVFDTTYRTNKYNLICAPFVGINNHRKNVMFGCAFISDERTETFEWLFDEFRKSMEGKYPITIFTDQDFAIAKGIEKVFPETRHRLCIWHLHQNAVSHFGKLKTQKCFQDTFKKCLSECVEEREFEDCWSDMIARHGLQDNHWFKRLYKLKDKWCTTLNKNYFSAGIQSSQRSESTNQSIGFRTRKDTNLTEFYRLFKGTVENWRRVETKDEFSCSWTEPETYLNKKGLIQHAREVYTSKIFREFEKEFLKCINATHSIVAMEDSTFVYDVESDETSRKVVYDGGLKLIQCSCMKFEESGILCYHCLRILNINSVLRIPDCYILKRWTKSAKSMLWDKIKNQARDGQEIMNADPWEEEMDSKYLNLISVSRENEAARRILEESFSRDSRTIHSLISTERVECTASESGSSKTVLDPTRPKTKGRSKRIQSSISKNRRKRTNSSQSAPTLEFSRNPHLL